MTDRRRVHETETETDRVLAELVTRIAALEACVDDLALLGEHLRETKLDKAAVADQVLELIRRVHR